MINDQLYMFNNSARFVQTVLNMVICKWKSDFS